MVLLGRPRRKRNKVPSIFAETRWESNESAFCEEFEIFVEGLFFFEAHGNLLARASSELLRILLAPIQNVRP